VGGAGGGGGGGGGGEIFIGITGVPCTQFTRSLVRSLSTRIFCAKFKTKYTMK